MENYRINMQVQLPINIRNYELEHTSQGSESLNLVNSPQAPNGLMNFRAMDPF